MGAAVGVVAGVIGGGGGGMLGGLLGGSGLLGGLGQLLGGFLGGSNKLDLGKVLEGFSPVNILNATANLINSINGGSVKEAARTLQKEDGLPKFLQEAIEKAVDKVLKENKKSTEGDVQNKLDNATKQDADKEINNLAKKMVDLVRKQIKEEGNESASGAQGGKKYKAKSWLMAIAEAMGQVLGEKAAKMVELTDKISAASEKQKAVEGKDEKDPEVKKAKEGAAREMTAAQAELNGVSQEFKILTEASNTVIKGIGDSLSTLGRRQ